MDDPTVVTEEELDLDTDIQEENEEQTPESNEGMNPQLDTVKGLAMLEGRINELSKRLEQPPQTQQREPEQKVAPPPSDPMEGFDWDNEDHATSQVVKEVLKRSTGFTRGAVEYVLSEVKKMIEPLQTGVKESKESAEVVQIQREIDDVREQHKDFDKFVPQIKRLIDSTPGLKIAQAYDLAKMEYLRSTAGKRQKKTSPEQTGASKETPTKAKEFKSVKDATLALLDEVDGVDKYFK